MENAVKALLIAAAVIVAIVLITLGMNLLNIGSESIDNVDFSEYQIEQFNSKFKKFEGTSVSGKEVNTLLTTVFNHNNQQEDKSTRVTVTYLFDESKLVDNTDFNAAAPKKVPKGNRYEVTCQYNSSTKLIYNINIDDVVGQTPLN